MPMIPFKYKLMISYLVLVLIPVLTLGVYAYNISVQSIREQAGHSIQGTLLQLKDNILYQKNMVVRTVDQIYWDWALQGSLREKDNNWAIYQTTVKTLVPAMQNAIHLTPNRAVLKLYVMNDQFPEMYALPEQGSDPLNTNDNFNFYHFDRITDESWYKALPEVALGIADSRMYWHQVENDDEFGNISLLRKFYDYSVPKQIGFIRVTVKIADMLSSVDHEKLGERTSVIVLDSSQRVIYADPQAGEVFPGAFWSNDWESGNLVSTQIIPDLNWKIIALVPDDYLEKGASKVKNLTIMICFLSFSIVTALSLFISRFFSKRIMKLIHSLNAFREGSFDKRIQYSGNDEFKQIAEAFNKMGQDLNAMIQEVYVANLAKKEAELASLQSQINPHFLYNTLSSISKLGKLGEIDKLDRMVVGLARFYRLTLNKGKTIITVQDELEQVKSYVEIQKIKFGDRLDIMYDIRSEVYGCTTIKLILQPFVENVLEHALFQRETMIRLCAFTEEEAVVFKIIDDGVGMDKEKSRRIWSQGKDQLGFGIRNVHDRIRLHFGPPYGVRIGSGQGIGTTVEIRIPINREK